MTIAALGRRIFLPSCSPGDSGKGGSPADWGHRDSSSQTQPRPLNPTETPMKTIVSALLALSFLAGAANASTPTPVKTDTVVEYGCGYGW